MRTAAEVALTPITVANLRAVLTLEAWVHRVDLAAPWEPRWQWTPLTTAVSSPMS